MACLVLATSAFLPAPAIAQQVDVEEITLDNGMTFLLLPRADQPLNVAAGWIAKVGSVNERPGITGMSHFFEHMMFKGTDTVGTREPEVDASYRARQTMIKRQILDETWSTQYERYRQGEIDDPWDPANDTPKLAELRAELRRLMDAHADHIVKNEFDQLYTAEGGSGMNAFTSYDVTCYFITVPSNKLELWAWMESDRLTNSVFREFYAERDVVHEERRLRTESTPTGIFQEQFDAMFWQSSPYGWPVIGWTSDLNSYTMAAAQEYYDRYYQPANLCGVIVGDFDVNEARQLIRTYFERIPAGDGRIPPVTTLEMPQLAEKRMYAECSCPNSVEVRYHTVPAVHEDAPALSMLASILNGQTGRLRKRLVEDLQIATSASASAGGMFGGPAKYAGAFSVNAEARGDIDPEELEAAWYEVLEELRTTPVPERELQKVKNQVATNAYRSLQSNLFLMIRLALFEALDDWTMINEQPRELRDVSADDIMRVANTYFDRTNRAVAIYTREAGAEPTDPAFAALDPETRAQVKAMLNQLLAETDVERLRMVEQGIQAQRQQMSEAERERFGPSMDIVLERLRAHIESLEG